MLKSIFLTGVGGQGVVTMANMISAHLQRLEYRVTLIHATGMAQRGGRVTSEIRFSDDASSNFGPRISSGGADYCIGMDMAETINSAAFLKDAGCLIYNDYTLIPSQAVLKKEAFPGSDEVEDVFKDRCGRIVAVRDPERPVNLFVLGVLAAVCGKDDSLSSIINTPSFEDTLREALTKRVDENLSAFRKGAEYGASV